MGQNKTVSCSFSSIGSYGRLGNQIFQYCLVKAICLKLHCDLYLHNNHSLKDYFDPNKLKYKDIKDSNHDFKLFKEKKQFAYDESVFSISEPTDFIGYFQNSTYFYDNMFEIFKTLEPQSSHIKTALNIIKSYASDTDDCCSVHIRRGDYLEPRNSKVFAFLDTKYYQNILHNIPNGKTIFILSDSIDYVKNEFKDMQNYNTIIFIDNKNPIINFYIMYLCRINIMANSTFSYWASFLSDKNNHKSVYYPYNWMYHDPQPTFFKNTWNMCSQYNKWLDLFTST